MKQIALVLLLLIIGYTGYSQQGFKIGLSGGLPLNQEANDIVSLVVGADIGYHHAMGEVVDAGIMTGFLNGFPEKFDSGGADLPHVQFLPLAASFRIWPSNSFSFGGDTGYAFGLNDGNEGGFYYKPLVGYLMGPQTEISLSYTGIAAEGLSWATVNLGVLYTFPQSRRW